MDPRDWGRVRWKLAAIRTPPKHADTFNLLLSRLTWCGAGSQIVRQLCHVDPTRHVDENRTVTLLASGKVSFFVGSLMQQKSKEAISRRGHAERMYKMAEGVHRGSPLVPSSLSRTMQPFSSLTRAALLSLFAATLISSAAGAALGNAWQVDVVKRSVGPTM